jgi:NADH:ubiquinone oxidoreductase subunit 3 (subunit A)
MIPQYSVMLAMLIFILVVLALLLFMLFLSWCVRPLRERPKGQETYECGFPAKGDARTIGFNYIHYATLFLIFDVAALYLFLYASIPQVPVPVTISFMLGILTLGLIILYGTKKRRYYVT